MWLKALIALAALAVVGVAGLQAGYLLTGGHSLFMQTGDHATPQKSRIIQVDGGGEG